MPALISTASTKTDPGIPVPLTSKFAYKFYAPIVLLKVLNAACDKKPSNSLDTSFDLTQSPEHVFHCFVNTLARLCDSDIGGNTVTAFTVLHHPDHIEYRFTSNQRDTEDFVRAKDFTSSILYTIGNIQGHDKESVISSILQKSLSFGRSRVTQDVKILMDQAEKCIAECEIECTDECEYGALDFDSKNLLGVSALSILEKLEELHEGPLVSHKESLNENEFAEHCESLIHSIHRLHQSEIHEFISNRAKEGKIDESEKWSELRHAAGRLLSYLRAAKFLVSMSKRWPDLFDKPTVSFVPSSVPDRCPFRGRRSPNQLSVHGIIGRMTSNTRKLNEYRAHAEDLQRFKLDEALQKMGESVRPFVHAEVLLLESLESGGGTHPSLFFNGYKYIGSSKPTCRLCCHYFSVHPSGVEVRRTHRNLYVDWRMPDVYEDQGPQAESDREDLMNNVLSMVRNETFRVLKEKLAEGRRHDSNTSSTYPRGSASFGGNTSMEDMTESLRDLDVQYSDYEEAMSSITETNSWDESEDEENGGVTLSLEAQYVLV